MAIAAADRLEWVPMSEAGNPRVDSPMAVAVARKSLRRPEAVNRVKAAVVLL